MDSFGGFDEFLTEILSVFHILKSSLIHSNPCSQAWIRKKQRKIQ